MIFFFKQKTAYEMRISDLGSDVCSSDLHDRTYPRRACPLSGIRTHRDARRRRPHHRRLRLLRARFPDRELVEDQPVVSDGDGPHLPQPALTQQRYAEIAVDHRSGDVSRLEPADANAIARHRLDRKSVAWG